MNAGRHDINPFIAPVCKIFGLKKCTRTLASGMFSHPVANRFQCCAFWCKSFHMLIRKRNQKCIRISNFTLLLVVFKCHPGSKRVYNNNRSFMALYLFMAPYLFVTPCLLRPVCDVLSVYGALSFCGAISVCGVLKSL